MNYIFKSEELGRSHKMSVSNLYHLPLIDYALEILAFIHALLGLDLDL